METTTEQTTKAVVCKRCAEMIFFVLERPCRREGDPHHEGAGWVARNVVDGDVHPCVNP